MANVKRGKVRVGSGGNKSDYMMSDEGATKGQKWARKEIAKNNAYFKKTGKVRPLKRKKMTKADMKSYNTRRATAEMFNEDY